jgi:hypothetical protein
MASLEAIEIEGAPLGTAPTPQLQPAKAVDESAQPTTARAMSLADLLAGDKRNDGTDWPRKAPGPRRPGDRLGTVALDGSNH